MDILKPSYWRNLIEKLIVLINYCQALQGFEFNPLLPVTDDLRKVEDFTENSDKFFQYYGIGFSMGESTVYGLTFWVYQYLFRALSRFRSIYETTYSDYTVNNNYNNGEPTWVNDGFGKNLLFYKIALDDSLIVLNISEIFKNGKALLFNKELYEKRIFVLAHEYVWLKHNNYQMACDALKVMSDEVLQFLSMPIITDLYVFRETNSVDGSGYGGYEYRHYFTYIGGGAQVGESGSKVEFKVVNFLDIKIKIYSIVKFSENKSIIGFTLYRDNTGIVLSEAVIPVDLGLSVDEKVNNHGILEPNETKVLCLYDSNAYVSLNPFDADVKKNQFVLFGPSIDAIYFFAELVRD